MWRTHDRPGAGHGGEVAGTANAEIRDLGGAFRGDEYVVGLNVPVYYAALVSRVKAQGYLVCYVHDSVQGHLSLGLDEIVQAEGKELQGHEVAFAVLAHIEYAYNVGVIDGSGQAGLSLEPLKVGSIPDQVRMHYLECDHLPRAGVPGPVYGRLTTGGDLFQYLISTYTFLYHL